MIGSGLALNYTGFILVQATCPMSSLSRSMTLFLSLGARSLQWGYKREEERWGVREVRSEGPRATGAPLRAKCLSVCLRSEPNGSGCELVNLDDLMDLGWLGEPRLTFLFELPVLEGAHPIL